MSSVFTKIIEVTLPSYKLFENEKIISFLTIEPIQKGHALVVPKTEIDHWLDVDDDTYLEVHRQAKVIGKAIQKVTDSPRIAQAVVGLEVPHFHLHLIPMWAPDDLDFRKAKACSQEEMKMVQEKILTHLSQ